MEIIEESHELKKRICRHSVRFSRFSGKNTILEEYQKLQEKMTIENIKKLKDEHLKILQGIIDLFYTSEENKQVEKILQENTCISILKLEKDINIALRIYTEIKRLQEKIALENINILKNEEISEETDILEKLSDLFEIIKEKEQTEKLYCALDTLTDIDVLKKEYLRILQKIIDSYDIFEENKKVIKSLQDIIGTGSVAFMQDEYRELSQKVNEIVNEIRKSQELNQETFPEFKGQIEKVKKIERLSKFKRSSKFNRKF